MCVRGKALHLLRHLKIKRSYCERWKPGGNIWTLCNIFCGEKRVQLNNLLIGLWVSCHSENSTILYLKKKRKNWFRFNWGILASVCRLPPYWKNTHTQSTQKGYKRSFLSKGEQGVGNQALGPAVLDAQRQRWKTGPPSVFSPLSVFCNLSLFCPSFPTTKSSTQGKPILPTKTRTTHPLLSYVLNIFHIWVSTENQCLLLSPSPHFCWLCKEEREAQALFASPMPTFWPGLSSRS